MKEAVNLIVFFACCTSLRAVSTAQRDLVVETPAAGASVLRQSTNTTCGGTSGAIEATFTNPTYPNAQTAALGSCTFKIKPMNENICQFRLDFNNFTLAQPNIEGICEVDFLQVTGAASSVPKICGDNAGQHMYVDVSSNGCSLLVNVDTSAKGSLWSIKIRQIECNSTNRAPPGCLQYFTTTTGIISSFNFNSTFANTFNTNRQLSNQGYGICIRPQPGYCSVTYSQAAGTSFSLNGDTGLINPGLTQGVVGSDCITDYLLIPNGFIVGISNTMPPYPLYADRFCGLAFPGVKSSIPPYNVYVVTDSSEILDGDLDNQGFKLTYRMNGC